MAEIETKVIKKPKPRNWKLAYDKYKRMAVDSGITPLSYRDWLIGEGIGLFEKLILATVYENSGKTKT